VLDDRWVQVRAALLGYADVPGVADVRRGVEDRRIHHLGARVAEILALGGRSITAPLEAYDAAAALWCLGDGFAILHRARPSIAGLEVSIDDGRGPRPWGLLAYGVRALLTEVSSPGVTASPTGPPPGPPIAAIYAEVSSRWTAAQRDALDAASALFVDRAAAAVGPADEIRSLGHVTVAAVARAAGVSRRSVYNHWSSSEELRLDLLRWLLSAERRRYVSALDRVIAAGRGAAERTGAAISSMLVHPSPDRLPLPHVPLAFLAEAHHPSVRAVLARGYGEMLDAVAIRVERLWPADRRASGAVLDADALAALLVSLATGANRLLRVHPAALRGAGTTHRPVVLVATLRALLGHHPAVTPTPG
jgi:AcrR family transcriptional regulator